MAFRNIFIKFTKEETDTMFEGELDVEYTGEIYYEVISSVDSDFSWPGGGIFEPPNGDVYYGCSCDLKEIRSFKKVEKE